MSGLSKFYAPGSKGERIIGSYLHPYCLFHEPDWNDPYSATQVIAVVAVDTVEVLITRNGGLFTRPPQPSDGPGGQTPQRLPENLAFRERVATVFNRIICEFALRGLVSEPAGVMHLSSGLLIDNHALITSTSGHREIYCERTTIPALQLLQGTWCHHRVHSTEIVDAVTRLEVCTKLTLISENAPALVAGAYSFYSRHQLAEALIHSWIVTEQIVDWLWKTHLSQVQEVSRREKLASEVGPSIAARLEVLSAESDLSATLHEATTAALKHYGYLEQRGKPNLKMVTETLLAMTQLIEFVCETTVELPIIDENVTLS